MSRHATLRALGVLLVLLTGSAAAVPASEPTDLPGFLDAAGAMTLAEAGRTVRDRSLVLGHLTISFAGGVATPILGKGGMPLGFYFEGSGGWRYTADSAAARETLRENVERAAKTLHLVGNDLTDTFERAVVLFTEPSYGEIWDASAAPAEKAPRPAGAEAVVADFLSKILSSYPEFDFRLAQARLNGRGRFVYAEFTGGLERIGYRYDDVRSGNERLFNFRKLADYDVRFTQTIASLDLPSWTQEFHSWLVLHHADIDIATRDNKSGTIATDLKLRVAAAGTRVIPLDLFNTFDPDAKSWDSPKYRLVVKRVVDDTGRELRFSHKYGELLVETPATLAGASEIGLRVETEGEVFLDMSGRHSDSYFMFMDGWMPQPAELVGSKFDYTIKVKTKKPWRPVTSGLEIELKEDGEYWIATSRSESPSWIIAVLAGKYVTRQETIDGLTVRVHAYAMARKNVLDNLPKLTAALVRFYSSSLGDMPVKELDVVEVPEYGFGISPSGVILITTEAYRAREDDIAKYLSRGINARLAHEVAHQWFAHKAIPADASDSWISESFAEYFSGLAMGALAAQDKTVRGFGQLLAEWRADNKICDDVAPISSANLLGGYGALMERRCLLYMRGPLVLHMLRTMMGDQRFLAANKLFLDRANVGPATTRDFARAVSETVGSDMTWFFDQWIDASGTPTIEVDFKLAPGTNGAYRLFGTMREAAGPRFKKVMVPLVYELDGKTTGSVVFLDQPEKAFEFSIRGKPGPVRVDPFGNNLAVYK